MSYCGASYHAPIVLKIMEIKMPWYIQTSMEASRRPINARKKQTLQKCSLKYCVECKKVWQNDWFSSKKKFIQYDDLPSYGVPRVQCTKCK